MWAFVRRRARRIIVCAVALSAAGAGIAYATIPDSAGVIHGCYQKDVGTLRVIDPSTGDTCRASESPISWSQTGPAGPQGPQGLPGTPGQNGTPGKNGKDGVSPTVAQLAPGDTHCGSGGAAITDAAGSTAYVCNGSNGKDGQPFSGTFTSPNGEFSVSVTDAGIKLQSPGAAISMTPATIDLKGAAGVDLQSDAAIIVKGAAGVDVEGVPILLNQAGCAPAARLGDSVTVAGLTGAAPGAPIIDPTGVIGQGSQSVCIGP